MLAGHAARMDEAIRDLERQVADNPAETEIIGGLIALAYAFLTHYRALGAQLQHATTLPPYAQSGAMQAADDLLASVDRTFTALDHAVSAYRGRR